MPDTTSAIMPYGSTFKIGDVKIDRLITTPDMGSSPSTINVSSHDDTTYERYIAGRMDVSTFDFEFYADSDAGNYNKAITGQRTAGTTYTLAFPDGTGYRLTGSHTAYKSSTDQSNALKFKISVVAETVEEITVSASSGGTGSGG